MVILKEEQQITFNIKNNNNKNPPKINLEQCYILHFYFIELTLFFELLFF